jgi:protein-S-isoprenylcysteine O-methyltransferase Ste14
MRRAISSRRVHTAGCATRSTSRRSWCWVGEASLFLSLPLLLYAVLASIGCHLFVVLYEQPMLRKRFGQDYELYLQNVWRWIPHPPKPTAPEA